MILNKLKKHTPAILKAVYHNLRYRIESIGLFLVYGIKSFWLKGAYSQHGQDACLREIFHIEKKLKCIIEVGANRPSLNSNSKLFDSSLKIISIDPIDYSLDYSIERPEVKFLNYAIGKEEGEAEFYEVIDNDGWQNQMSSFNLPDERFEYKLKTVNVRRLSSIITENRKYIDGEYLLMLDVEGWELNVLESLGANLELYPRYILIECIAFDFQLIKYLKKMGYKIVARLGPTDSLFEKC